MHKLLLGLIVFLIAAGCSFENIDYAEHVKIEVAGVDFDPVESLTTVRFNAQNDNDDYLLVDIEIVLTISYQNGYYTKSFNQTTDLMPNFTMNKGVSIATPIAADSAIVKILDVYKR